MCTYGYVRVSSRDQNEARQLAAMAAFGIPPDSIFTDKQSGKDFERPQYKRLMRKLRDGDTIVVKSIDRLGRDYDEILSQWRVITKRKKAAIVVRDVTGTLIADIVLELLSYVAHQEREFIRQRQAEGIAEAKRNGVRFGRSAIPRPDDYPNCATLWREGELSSRAAAKRLDISHVTFLRWVHADDGD